MSACTIGGNVLRPRVLPRPTNPDGPAWLCVRDGYWISDEERKASYHYKSRPERNAERRAKGQGK